MNNNIIDFFYEKEEYPRLHNFWECQLVLVDEEGNMREYSSGEHYLHGEKFIRIGKECKEMNRQKELIEYGNRFTIDGPYDKFISSHVKKMRKGLPLYKEELELWNKLTQIVQQEICNYKFYNYEEIRNDLEKTKGKIETINRNLLSNIWMKIRDSN